MNILFVNNSEVNPLHSGIQRITWVLAKAFEGRGMACYGANFEKDTPTVNGLFRAVQKLDFTEEAAQELAAFIRRHGITRVIVQECWPLKKLAVVSRATRSVEGCKLLYCYHSMPGKEFVPPSAGAEFYRLLHGQGKIRTLKKGMVALLPRGIFRRLVAQRTRRDYAFMWEAADEIVLLSASYIPLVEQLAGKAEGERKKFWAIGNSLSFQAYLPEEEILRKRKEVVIVARLSERVKRISTALKIWQRVERGGKFPEWRLKIVGTGEDEEYYRHLAQRLGLQQADFEGRQAPQEYYRRAAICMLTSAYEGFGIVLTEAQQMGAVPIAFDTYAAIHDIIQEGRNGVLVPQGNAAAFAEALERLMDNEEERGRLARHAIEDCKRFDEEHIIREWSACLG